MICDPDIVGTLADPSTDFRHRAVLTRSNRSIRQ